MDPISNPPGPAFSPSPFDLIEDSPIDCARSFDSALFNACWLTVLVGSMARAVL